MFESRITTSEVLRNIAKGSFFLGLLLGFGAYFLNGIINDFLISWNQETTEARVLSFEEDWEERDDGQRVVQVFNFTYGFTTPSGQYCEGNGKIYSEPPETIIIAYDSKNPENNRLRTDFFYRFFSPPIKLLLLALIGFYLLRMNIKFLWDEIIAYQQAGFNAQNQIIQKLESQKGLFLFAFVLLYIVTGLAPVRFLTYDFLPFLRGPVWMVTITLGGGGYLWLWLRKSFIENLLFLSLFVLWVALMFVSLNLNDLYPEQFSESSENIFLLLSFLSGMPIGCLAGLVIREFEKRRCKTINLLTEQSQKTGEAENQIL